MVRLIADGESGKGKRRAGEENIFDWHMNMMMGNAAALAPLAAPDDFQHSIIRVQQ